MYINVYDLRIHYEISGSGYPLILLHGNGGTMKSFERVLPELEKYFTCIRLDTRWHGKTSKGDKTTSLCYEQFADDLYGFWQLLRKRQNEKCVGSLEKSHISEDNDIKPCVSFDANSKPHIIGYSDGGITALIFAAKYSGWVGKVITLGANFDLEGMTPFYEWIYKTIKKNKPWRFLPQPRRTLALMNLMIENESYPPFEMLQSITTNVLMLCGDTDDVPIEHTRRIVYEICKGRTVDDIDKGHTCIAKYKKLSNCGHSIMKQQAEAFLNLTLDFFQE